MARIRTDVALTVAAAALIGLGAQFATTKVIEATNRPAEYMAVEITDGSVGAQADDDTPRAQSIAEIKTQAGLFTIELESNRHYNPMGTDDFYCIKLDSGEYILARVLRDSITQDQDKKSSMFYGEYTTILPIGQLVKEPAPAEVLQKAELYYEIPDDSSFYVDMRGTHKSGKWYQPRNAKQWGENAFLLTTMVLTVVFWQIMVRLGLFAPLLPKKAKPTGQQQ